ncbi:MAG: archaeosine biosynthesis radical SAM protein RaSEA [Candidatus Thermoplasmatota archaeon]
MNEILSNITQNIRRTYTPYVCNLYEPVSVWSEKDTINNKVTDALVIILRTRGCGWGKNTNCTMCGYFTDTTLDVEVPSQDLILQFNKAIKKYRNEEMIKIYTSGSFLDEHEIPTEVREYILKNLPEKIKALSIESRPEYIKEDTLDEIQRLIPDKDLEIGIGLETSNDYIREYSINKGFTFNDYKRTSDIIKRYNYKIKTYVLVKPLFLTECEAIKDAVNTVKDTKRYTDKISFNPVNIQRYTLVEYLWRTGQYHPSWLWSIIEIIKESSSIIKNNRKIHLKCEPVGGGTKHGAHNCGACDHITLKKIREYNLTQDSTIFNNLDCRCKELWIDQLELEGISFGVIKNTRAETR